MSDARTPRAAWGTTEMLSRHPGTGWVPGRWQLCGDVSTGWLWVWPEVDWGGCPSSSAHSHLIPSHLGAGSWAGRHQLAQSEPWPWAPRPSSLGLRFPIYGVRGICQSLGEKLQGNAWMKTPEWGGCGGLGPAAARTPPVRLGRHSLLTRESVILCPQGTLAEGPRGTRG